MPFPLASAFDDLPDPRRPTKNQLHALTDVLIIAVCAIISGAEGWEQIAEYGRRKEAFFRRFLRLANGIPSHDTFYNVFRALDPDAFAKRFGAWMMAACEPTGLIPIAIDGKSARRAKRAIRATFPTTIRGSRNSFGSPRLQGRLVWTGR